ncbi:MAG: hypothetical protein KBT75_07905 [Oleispira antarctica]|nr:hypothetical protein [Oleispira antarctica]
MLKDGEVIVSESGAILCYLAEKSDTLLPKGLLKRTKVIEMLMLQMSGLEPNFGQLLVWPLFRWPKSMYHYTVFLL